MRESVQELEEAAREKLRVIVEELKNTGEKLVAAHRSLPAPALEECLQDLERRAKMRL